MAPFASSAMNKDKRSNLVHLGCIGSFSVVNTNWIRRSNVVSLFKNGKTALPTLVRKYEG